MVEADYADLVEEEFHSFLCSTRFKGSPVVRFSARTGQGEPELRGAILAALEGLELRDSAGPARMPVDRVFTMDGFGTVVTGTLWRGTVRVGDTLVLEPSGRKVRVRTVESHGSRVEEVGAGRRAAISLHPLSREEAGRGDWLVAEASGAPSRRASVRVELLPDAPRALTSRTGVRFHLGAGDTLAVLRLIGQDTLEPGQGCVAQLELRHPVPVERGDRFVLRTASAEQTLGGGTVIEPRAERVRAHDGEALAALLRSEAGSPAERVLEALEKAAGPKRVEELAKQVGMEPAEVAAALAELRSGGGAREAGDGVVSSSHWEGALARMLAEVEHYQAEFPVRFGIGKGELKSRLQRELPASLFDPLLQGALGQGALHAREDRLARAAEVPLPAAAAVGAARILEVAKTAGLEARGLAELAAEGGVSGQETVLRLVFDRKLARLAGDLVFDAGALEQAAGRVTEALRSKPRLAVADFKEIFGLSRKYMMPLLEHLDSLGVTRREGEGRVAGKSSTPSA